MATRHDYTQQAARYDTSRAASPSVLAPLRGALQDIPGPRLVDVGGGTGNYSSALRADGLRPVVTDLNAAMLDVARAKDLPVVRADATALPIPDGSVDAVAVISMLHHVPDWRRALAEGRRILRPGGRLALLAFAREHLDVHWVMRYFPATTAAFVDGHQPLGDLLDALPGATVTPVRYEDLVDGSMAAMCRRPETLLDPGLRRQTSYFERAENDHPDELAAGLDALRRDLAAGLRPEREVDDERRRIGDASLVTWTAGSRAP